MLLDAQNLKEQNQAVLYIKYFTCACQTSFLCYGLNKQLCTHHGPACSLFLLLRSLENQLTRKALKETTAIACLLLNKTHTLN